MGVKSFLISFLANAVVTVAVLVFSEEIKRALPSNTVINWLVNNVLYVSGAVLAGIIIWLVLNLISNAKKRVWAKYFSFYKASRLTVAEAARLFLMPAANRTFFNRSKVEELFKTYGEAEVKKPGILLKGPSGVGKSRLAYHLAITGLNGRKFKTVLVPHDVTSLEFAVKDGKLKVPAKSILIFDNFEDFAGVEGLVAFIEKNRSKCFYVATVRGERTELLMEDGLVAGIPKVAVARFHEINVPKLSAGEAAEAAAALGEEAPGYDAKTPPDTFAWLVRDLTHELRYYEDCKSANAPEALVLEALALAASSGYIKTPPNKAEVAKLTEDILGYTCDVSLGLANLEKAERITLREGAYNCRFEYLAAVWSKYVALRVRPASRISAALNRKTEEDRREALLILALISYEKGERELAFGAIATALEGFPNHADAHFVAGNIYAVSDPEKAAVFYDGALRINPEYAYAHNNYAILLKKLGRDEEAESHYREALRINPEDAEAHYNYAILLRKLGRDEEAERHYREALRLNPEYEDAHNNYAILLKKLGRDEEAERHYLEALRINPEAADAHYNYAILLNNDERHEEAEGHYRDALRINPEYGEAHNNYANLLQKLGRDEEAEGHYLDALRINPEDGEAHNNYGVLLKKLGRDEEAEGHYSEALRINPEDGAAFKNYAVLLEKLGRDEEAEGRYREALRINCEDGEAHNNYGVLLEKLGRDAEAEGHYREVLRITPECAEAHNNYAILLQKLGRDEEAEGHYREALKINPVLPEALGAFSQFLAERGRCAEAKASAARFFELAPEHPNVTGLKKVIEERCPGA